MSTPTDELQGPAAGPGRQTKTGVTAERAREGSLPEGDDMASTTRRSRNIPGIYAQPSISLAKTI